MGRLSKELARWAPQVVVDAIATAHGRIQQTGDSGRSAFLFSLLYSGQFILLGIQLPFFAGWIERHDYNAAAIGVLTGAALLARLAFGAFIAAWADRQADPMRALRGMSALFALGGVGLVAGDFGVPVIGISAFVVLWTFGVLIPLTDTAVLRAEQVGRLHYGATRAFGSFIFLLTTVLGGVALAHLGIGAVAVIMASAACFTFCISLIAQAPQKTSSERGPPVWRAAPILLGTPVFLLAIVTAGLIQGAHAVYYSFSYLQWSAIGYSDGIIGLLWATGVAVEIVLLLFAKRLRYRVSAPHLLFVAGAAAFVRWGVIATQPPLWLLFLAKLLHAATFALAYLGALAFIERATPPRLVNTAMTLMSATGVGAITGVATITGGYLWTEAGPYAAYALMAGMGFAAAGLALVLAKFWDGGFIVDESVPASKARL